MTTNPLDQYEQEISKWCEELKFELLYKYRKGKSEHGGEPTKIDCDKEMAQEIMDIINYHCISLVNNR